MDDHTLDFAREIYVRVIAQRMAKDANLKKDHMQQIAGDALQAAEAFFAALAKE
jgi:hypothetical protein